MPPTYSDSTTWRIGVIALFALAVLMAAMPVRAQPTFADACPATLEATATGDGSVLLEVEASAEVVIDRTVGNETVQVARLDGSGAYVDANVSASTSYVYHVALLLAGQQSPPCDEAQVTTQAKADAAAKSNATGNTTGNATAQGNATADVEAHVLLEACPATIEAQTRGEGQVVLRINASTDVDGAVVYRDGGGQAVRVGQLSASGDLVDDSIDAGIAYTYHVRVLVDGQESDVCDSLELASTPFFPGATAVLAVAAMTLGYAWYRRK